MCPGFMVMALPEEAGAGSDAVGGQWPSILGKVGAESPKAVCRQTPEVCPGSMGGGSAAMAGSDRIDRSKLARRVIPSMC